MRDDEVTVLVSLEAVVQVCRDVANRYYAEGDAAAFRVATECERTVAMLGAAEMAERDTLVDDPRLADSL
jgi:hypothetical protein